jgi:internalin A
MTDLEFINQIERALDVKLEKLNVIEGLSQGYILNLNGRVTGISLSRCKVGNLNRIVGILKELANLTQLGLSVNQLIDINPLKELTNLTQLGLSNNQLSDINPLKGLTSLKQLELHGNQLSDISPLKELTNLTHLNLGSNKLYDISSLTELSNLIVLILYDNQLSDITPLKELTNLTELYLGQNQLTSIHPLENLTNLKQLVLDDNKFDDISPLQDLRSLTGLSLMKNNILDLTPLQNLRSLMRLDLREIPIEELPQWITSFNMELQWTEDVLGWDDGFISFKGNPLKNPPPEIVQQGKEAIRNYFAQLQEQAVDYLFEAKMLIIGEPGAGKTTLARKMQNPDCALPQENETTKGIMVNQYYFPLNANDFPTFKHPDKLANRNFRLNLWDFGGQEIYKATHRFFLSKRSLYALVADSRNEDTDFNYWLHIEEMFGGDSPLLIVLNEKHQRKRNLDISAMQQRFKNISQVLDVDFAEADKIRLSKLEKVIKYWVSQLPHIGSPVPAKWTVIREAIEKDPRNTITQQDYLTLCRENGITQLQDALVLSQYFHDVGVFLHFQEDAVLKNTIFLKPNWATNAVYKILDHEILNRKNGRFNKEDANVIWSESDCELIRDQLLRLMQKFFLSYEIGKSGEYIVPERLPAKKPEYTWDERENLLLCYEYEYFMPRGIMSQFTVEMHPYITNHDRVWRRGVVIERDNTRAEIIETYDSRNIKIRVVGKHRRDFMTLITERLDQLNGQFDKLRVEKLIPCNCLECKIDNHPHFYKYNDLKRRLENRKQDVECGNSYEMINVRSLVDEVLNMELRNAKEEAAFISDSPQPVQRNKVFISYSRKDGDWLSRVETHVQALNNTGFQVELWDDTKIKAGEKWQVKLREALDSAKVAILLVSTDFLASDFIKTDELPPLLKAAEEGGAAIIPVILKPCLFSKHPKLTDFQGLNDPAQPLSKLTPDEQEEKLVALMERIAELMEETIP